MRSKLTFLIVSLLGLSLPIAAQDLMYKSNGEKTKVQVVSKTRQNLSYRLWETKDSTLHYITTATLDSVIYQNGTRELYVNQREIIQPEKKKVTSFGRNLTGVDGAALLFNNALAFSYEYLLLDYRLGIKAQVGKDLSERGYYDDKWNYYSFQKGEFVKFGFNWYFFPPGSFRVSTGLYFIASSYKIHSELYINNPDPPYDTTIQKVEENRNFRNLGLAVFAYYQITKNLAVNAGIDVPNNNPDNSDAGGVFRSEILLNF